jgi:hypothetical protein
MLTYAAKLLIIPALVAVATTGLLAFLACRGLIGLCVPAPREEDAA